MALERMHLLKLQNFRNKLMSFQMLPPLDPTNLLESSMAGDASPRTQNLKKVAERQPGPHQYPRILDSG